MTPRFEFATAGRIIFGAGAVRDAGRLLREVRPEAAGAGGGRVLCVTGSRPERAGEAAESLRQAGIAWVSFPVSGEPTVQTAGRGAELARAEGCSAVLAVGGGSVIDAAKAIAALAANPGDPLDYLEVVGRGMPLARPSLPCVAVPTTAGTGAEVTRNAVLMSPEHAVKASLRSPHMLPRLALVDPELTWSMPPAVTAATGLDALTQLIEPFVSVRANPLTDGVCREGIARAARSLRRAFEDGRDARAREDMSIAGLFGGLALANAGLGAVHGFAGPIGGMFPAPHGAVCAALLPHVLGANIRALRRESPGGPVLDRCREIAVLVTGRSDARPEEGVEHLAALVRELQVPGLGAYGVTAAHVESIVGKSRAASSMKGNPVRLGDEELTEIVLAAL